MRVVEVIDAWGHPNISAKNRTTFEITRDDHLTLRGDCIIAIKASKGAKDLSEEFKSSVRSENATITIIIEAGTSKDVVVGRGHPHLTLSHPHDLVVRKSTYVSDRTLAVGANKTAFNFSKNLKIELQKPFQKVTITLIVEV